MTVWYKQGVLGDLSRPARKGLGRVAQLYADQDLDLFVTSLRDGNHMPGSLHYDGGAFDIRTMSIPKSDVKKALGDEWDVLEYKNKGIFHCEYDPKQPER